MTESVAYHIPLGNTLSIYAEVAGDTRLGNHHSKRADISIQMLNNNPKTKISKK